MLHLFTRRNAIYPNPMMIGLEPHMAQATDLAGQTGPPLR
jgi:hypothetical protein